MRLDHSMVHDVWILMLHVVVSEQFTNINTLLCSFAFAVEILLTDSLH